MKDSDPDLATLQATMGKWIGSGITKHLVLFPDSAKDYKDIKRVRGTMFEYLGRIETEAWDVLYDSVKFVELSRYLVDAIRKGETGLPSDWLGNDPIPDFDSRTWAQNCPRTASMLCFSIEKMGFKPYDDDEWFAARVVKEAHRLSASLYDADVQEQTRQFYSTHPDGHVAGVEQQVQNAMNLAALQTEWRLKKQWENRATRHEAGGAAIRKKTQPAKDYAIQKATEIWSELPPVLRIGKVVSMIQISLESNGMKAPKELTIRGWLKAAEKAGTLRIPEGAKRPGANKQKK